MIAAVQSEPNSVSAQNHCQVGNYRVALTTIVNWLDAMVQTDSPEGYTRIKAT